MAPNDEYFYIARERLTPTEECLEEETAPITVEKFGDTEHLIAHGLDNEDTTGVGVDQEANVYADNADSVAAFTAGGTLIQRFGSGEVSGAGALAMDPTHGEVYLAEPATGKVAVFTSAPAGAPTVDSVDTQRLSSTSERLNTEIDPDGADTTYLFPYRTWSCVTEPSGCTDVPAASGADVGSGFGDTAESVELTGLQPNTTYYYRVLAHNTHGTAESPQAAETFFTTLPSAEATLPDHRASKPFQPPDKHGAEVEGISREGSVIQASASGDALTWTASGPVTGPSEGDRAPEPVQVFSKRDATEGPSEGWASEDITTPHNRGEGITAGAAPGDRFFTPDLSLALVEPQGAEPATGKPAAGAYGDRKNDVRPQQRHGRIRPTGNARRRHRGHEIRRHARIRRCSAGSCARGLRIGSASLRAKPPAKASTSGKRGRR